MARRGSNAAVVETDENTPAAEVTEEVAAPVEESADAPAEAPTEEASEVTDEAAVATAEAAEEERDTSGDTVITNGQSEPADKAVKEGEADLTPLQTVANEVVAGHDPATGNLPEGGLERVLAVYQGLPSTKDRNRAKKWLQERVAEGIEQMDMPVAKGFLHLADNMTTATAKSGGGTKAPADPTARWKQQLEIVTLAYGELFNNRPEGVDEEQVNAIVGGTASLTEQVATLRAHLDAPAPAEGEEAPEEPKVDDRVKAAMRLVRGGKVTGGTSRAGGTSAPHDGPRRNIGKHIASAFAEVESGTFLTVAQIAAHKSEEYGDDKPSPGAISARLFPASGTCTVEGIVPGTGGEKDQRGARKA